MTIGLSFAITLIIFSYLLADNILYRLAVAVFVGLAAAFTTIVTVESVLVPLFDGSQGNTIVLVIAAIITGFLLLKPIPRLTYIGNIGLAYLIAVGTAAAVVGALTGTLVPIGANITTINEGGTTFSLINGVIVLLGVITSLMYFQYTARPLPDGTVRRPAVIRALAGIGEGFIVVTLGALYGAAILTSLTILTGQLASLFTG